MTRRTRNFLVFFTVAFTAYGLINYFIFLHGWEAFASCPTFREVAAIIFWVVVVSFIAGRFLERAALSWFSTAMVWMGSLWLAAMVYFFIVCVAIDVLRLANAIVPFFPYFITDYQSAKEITAISVIVVVFIAVAWGYYNAVMPRVTELEFHIPKKIVRRKEIIIAAASDIHLGTIISHSRLSKIVEKLNAMDADLVLLPGDVIDEDLGPVIKKNLGETLRKIRSKHGVFAVTGNHEYIGGAEEACAYLIEHGITMLRDEHVRVMDGLYLVGREDLSARMFNGQKRKELSEIMNGVDKSAPILLMDHQPYKLQTAAENGVDVQLSGHTHHAQMWPFNLLTQAIYEVSWGYKKKGSTHVYVSCGAGTWGPPVRIGSHSEVMRVKLVFE